MHRALIKPHTVSVRGERCLVRQAQSERDGRVTSNKAGLLCTWEIKATGGCFYILLRYESNTNFRKHALMFNSPHIVPQSNMLSIKT